jgi:hypothetical protein
MSEHRGDAKKAAGQRREKCRSMPNGVLKKQETRWAYNADANTSP